jgi:hypothetical protein
MQYNQYNNQNFNQMNQQPPIEMQNLYGQNNQQQQNLSQFQQSQNIN